MENMALDELQSIVLNKENYQDALIEISARVDNAINVARHYRKIGFTVDAQNLEKTIAKQQRFLAYAASLDK